MLVPMASSDPSLLMDRSWYVTFSRLLVISHSVFLHGNSISKVMSQETSAAAIFSNPSGLL